MRYATITQDGQFAAGATPDWRIMLAACGDEGANRVQLTRTMVAYVGDCSLIMPEKYLRNPIAGVVLMTLGAPRIPYAGTVVFVGWDQSSTARNQVEIVDLSEAEICMLADLHGTTQAVVTGTDVYGPAHTREVLAMADIVLHAHPPITTIQ